MKEFEIELKTKTDFIWCHIPIIKVSAIDKSEAIEKALNKADKIGFRRIALELNRIEKIRV